MKLLLFASALVTFLAPLSAQAGSATWNAAANGKYGMASNWTPATVPTNPGDIATFGASNSTAITISTSPTVDAWDFTAGASAYSFTIGPGSDTLSFVGAGIINLSAHAPAIALEGSPSLGTAQLKFMNDATAGNVDITVDDGFITFADTATAGKAVFDVQEGEIAFEDSSSAAQSAITLAAATQLVFSGNAAAGSATITNNGGSLPTFGGATQFTGDSSAAGSTLIANGTEFPNIGFDGMVQFLDASLGGTSHLRAFGTGVIDLEAHDAPGITVGSLEGDGTVFLGGNNLAVGNGNRSSTFAGTIREDARDTPQGGSLSKVGTGDFTLTGENRYTGETTIEAGRLLLNGSIKGAVRVNGGATLGGQGTVDSVIVEAGGTVAPGGPRTLTVNSTYTQTAGARLALLITGTGPTAYDRLVVGTNASIEFNNDLELDFTGGFAPKAGDTFTLISANTVSGGFTTVTINGLEPGFQYDFTASTIGSLVLTARTNGVATTAAVPVNLLNISTRVDVQGGDNILIGGFIISGTVPKKVLVRGLGPSLAQEGVEGVLADPVLELHEPNGTVITNDNWMTSPQVDGITASGVAPTDPLESAILATLAPGTYTATMHGAGDDVGIGLVEVYDLDRNATTPLANISTRGLVETGDNVMIGGFIAGAGGGNVGTIIVRGIGPSLTADGVAGALADPAIELHDGNGDLIGTNDNWQDGPDEAEIAADGLAPKDAAESALLAHLTAGNYTVVLRGVNDGTGVGLVEVYNVQ